MRNATLFSITIVIVLIYSSCGSKGGPCEEMQVLDQSEIIVTFKNQTGDYIYSESNPSYNKDSLTVFDGNNKQLILLDLLDQIPGTSLRFYKLSFGVIFDKQTDQQAFRSEVCKDFVIHYNSLESDTLRACFKAEKTMCGSQFERLNIYHRGQLLTSVSNTVVARITFVKP